MYDRSEAFDDDFCTTDIVIGAYLRTLGHSLTVEPTDGRYALFRFPNKAKIDADALLVGDGKVDPFRFMDSRRELLRRMTAMQERDGGR